MLVLHAMTCRQPGRAGGRAVLGVLVSQLLLVSCVTVITPPPAPSEPVDVIVADYGRHSSLLLPRSDGSLAEYAYGEWRWFALLDAAWWRVPAVLLWPTRGTLGRRRLPGPATASALRAQTGALSFHRVTVDRPSAEALLAWLDARWESQSATSWHNAIYDLDFVHDDHGFWLGHTCNAAVAEWLASMGCRVSSPTWVAAFEVRPVRDARGPR
jgi:hypothetical protein